MKTKATKKLLSLLLSLTMAVSLLTGITVTAFADTPEPAAAEINLEEDEDQGSAGTITGGDTVNTSGEYTLASGATGTITINAPVVTITGSGSDEIFTDLNLVVADGVSLTIKDLYTKHSMATAPNTIKYLGSGSLNIEGTNVMLSDTATRALATVYIGQGNTLTMGGSGTWYSYFNGVGGVCIGAGANDVDASGNSCSVCGNVTINSGTWFFKNSKRTCNIGSDSSSTKGGTITFNGGEAYFKGLSMAPALGSTYQGLGSDVVVNKGANVTVYEDYTGLGISGNGSPTLTVNGGSLKLIKSTNAVNPSSTSDLTAYSQAACGATTDKAMFIFDASAYASADSITVMQGDTVIYEGKLSSYVTNEIKNPGSGDLSATIMLNWMANDSAAHLDADTAMSGGYPTTNGSVLAVDNNLGLWLDKQDTVLTVNGDPVSLTWDAENGTFVINESSDQYTISSAVKMSSKISETAVGGTVTVAGSADQGSTVSVTAAPESGYYLAELTAVYTVTGNDGVETEVSQNIDTANNGRYDGLGGTYTFEMPAADVEIEATFITTTWDGSLDFTWYNEHGYVANEAGSYYMYYPAQWEALAWITSEDLYFLTDASVDLTAAAAQDSTKTVAEYMESKGWDECYQYNTNGNVVLVTGTIPSRDDLHVGGNTETGEVYGGSGQNYFSGKTFYIMNDMNFGGVGTDYFDTTELVSLTSTYTGADDPYYSHMSGPDYYPVGSQAKNDGVYKNLQSTTSSADYHYYGVFCGSVDGQGHLMDNIYCDRGDASNIGGATGGSNYYQSTALIGRLGLPDSTSTTLAQNDAVIENIAVDGFIYGERSVGGIVGKTLHVATGYKVLVKNCMNFATIWSTQSKGSGGIIGAAWNGSYIENCVNFGRCINGYTNACGGITGSSEATIKNTYNVGMVSLRSGNPASFASKNSTTTATDCYSLIGSTYSGNGNYSTASTPYLHYNFDANYAPKAIDTLADASTADFLSKINSNGTLRVWVNVGTSATEISNDVTLKSDGVANELKTSQLFYNYDGTTKSIQTGVANLPIPRVFLNDTSTVAGVTAEGTPVTAYQEGQSFNIGTLVMTRNYSDNTSEVVADYTVSNAGPYTVEDNGSTITVSGDGFSYDYTITVTETTLENVVVTTAPTKKAYFEGEALDLTGAKVTLTFGNGLSIAASYTDGAFVGTDGNTYNITVSGTDSDGNPCDLSSMPAAMNGQKLTFTAAFRNVSLSAQPSTALDVLAAADKPEVDDEGYYVVTTAAQLNWIAALVNTSLNLAPNVKLGADIIASDDFAPIGKTSSISFGGTFDGQGHAVTLSINTSSTYQGLFGYVKNGTVKNTVVCGTVTAGNYSAGLVGYINGGTISNCGNEAAVSGTAAGYLGGLVAYMNNTSTVIENCYNKGDVTNTTGKTGGIAGCAYAAGTIRNCYNAGTITGTASSTSNNVGGIVGNQNAAATIVNCYNIGAINPDTEYSGTSVYQGAIAGYASTAAKAAAVTNSCYLEGTADYAVGGSSAVKVVGTTFSAENPVTAAMLGDDTGSVWMNDEQGLNSGYPILTWEYVVLGDPSFNGRINIIDAQVAYDIAQGVYAGNANLHKMTAAADFNKDGAVDALDARAIQIYVHTGASGK